MLCNYSIYLRSLETSTHEKINCKQYLENSLEEIKGLGETTKLKNKLRSQFKSFFKNDFVNKVTFARPLLSHDRYDP